MEKWVVQKTEEPQEASLNDNKVLQRESGEKSECEANMKEARLRVESDNQS